MQCYINSDVPIDEDFVIGKVRWSCNRGEVTSELCIERAGFGPDIGGIVLTFEPGDYEEFLELLKKWVPTRPRDSGTVFVK